MRKVTGRAIAFALAVAMAIPMMGMSAKAQKTDWVAITNYTIADVKLEEATKQQDGSYYLQDTTNDNWAAAQLKFTSDDFKVGGKYKIMYELSGVWTSSDQSETGGFYVNQNASMAASQNYVTAAVHSYTADEAAVTKEIVVEAVNETTEKALLYQFILRKVGSEGYCTISNIQLYQEVTSYEVSVAGQRYDVVAGQQVKATSDAAGTWYVDGTPVATGVTETGTGTELVYTPTRDCAITFAENEVTEAIGSTVDAANKTIQTAKLDAGTYSITLTATKDGVEYKTTQTVVLENYQYLFNVSMPDGYTLTKATLKKQ